MNNFLKYFYNIDISNYKFEKDYYCFKYNGNIYKLYIIDKSTNINYLVNIDKKLLNYTLISEIVINKYNDYISFYNNINYVLLKIFVDLDRKVTLNEICYFDNLLYTKNLNINWGLLWSRKIDYLENLINENGKKYPLIVDSFNYFVGMAENAISYYNKITIPKDCSFFLSHKYINLNNSLESIYNPLNVVFDYKTRDIAEYIKISYFNNNSSIIEELNKLITNNYLSLFDIKLIIARLLYPSFYFNFYENILVQNESENILINIVNRLDDYEKYLSDIIDYFRKYYNIEEIEWLK